MDRWGFSGVEVWGVFVIAALRAGDIDGVAKILAHARLGYRRAPLTTRDAFRLQPTLASRHVVGDGGRSGCYIGRLAKG